MALYLAAGALLVLVAVWVLWADPKQPLNRTLGFLLLLFAGSTVALGRLHGAGEPLARAGFLEVIYWYEVPALFLFALFLDQFFFDQPRTRDRRFVLAGVAAVVVTMLAVLAWRPGWYTTKPPGEPPFGMPWGWLYGLGYHSLWAATIVLAGRTTGDRAGTPLGRKKAALVGLAFCILAGHTVGKFLGRLALDGPGTWMSPPNAGLIATAIAIAYALPRLPAPFEGRARGGLVAVMVLPVLAGIYGRFAGTLDVLDMPAVLPGNPRPIVLTLFALVLGVAVVRFGLAGFRANARRELARSTGWTLLLVGGGLLVGLSLFTYGTGPRGLGLAVVGMMAPIAAAFTPLRRLPERFVDGLLLEPDDAEVMRERVRIYRSALEEALGSDGQLREGTETVLANLRAELDLTERDHAVLVSLIEPADPESTDHPLLGRYLVDEKIGAGTHGRAYRAKDTVVGRTVVLKRLHLTEPTRDKLRDEMHALAELDHPHIVTLYTAEVVGDELVLVLEHLDGGTLADRLDQAPLPIEDALGTTLALLDALAAVHEAGIAHGDVAPGNLFFSTDGTAKLGDFGAARRLEPDETEDGTRPLTEATLTTMAPEQVRGQPATPATDVYAAAALAYRMLTGQPPLPLEGRSRPQAMTAILEAPPRLPHARVPDALEPVLRTALARDPADRYEDAAALRDALEAAIDGLQAGAGRTATSSTDETPRPV